MKPDSDAELCSSDADYGWLKMRVSTGARAVSRADCDSRADIAALASSSPVCSSLLQPGHNLWLIGLCSLLPRGETPGWLSLASADPRNNQDRMSCALRVRLLSHQNNPTHYILSFAYSQLNIFNTQTIEKSKTYFLYCNTMFLLPRIIFKEWHSSSSNTSIRSYHQLSISKMRCYRLWGPFLNYTTCPSLLGNNTGSFNMGYGWMPFYSHYKTCCLFFACWIK